jgi:hypothetical protein
MEDRVIHMRFRDVAPLSLLFAAVEKSYPHFLSTAANSLVDDGGKADDREVFRTLHAFSTAFPHEPVDRIDQ